MQKQLATLKEKIGRGSGCGASWHLRFFNNTFMFCVYDVCCNTNEESAFKRSQKITREEKTHRIIEQEKVQRFEKENMRKKFVKGNKKCKRNWRNRLKNQCITLHHWLQFHLWNHLRHLNVRKEEGLKQGLVQQFGVQTTLRNQYNLCWSICEEAF